jgi:hypothetical protein
MGRADGDVVPARCRGLVCRLAAGIRPALPTPGAKRDIFLGPDQILEAIAATRRRTDRLFNVNLFAGGIEAAGARQLCLCRQGVKNVNWRTCDQASGLCLTPRGLRDGAG